jgi:hypothetical protein
MSAARTLLALLIFVGALAGSSTALADPPARAPVELDDFTTEAGDVCSFPVLFEILREKGTVTFFSDGRLLVTGQLQVRLTNLWDSQKSLELNISGPGWIADRSGAEVALGTGIFILFAGFDSGGPALLLNHGRFEVTRAPNGSITNIQAYGTSADLCALLA